MWDYDVGDKVYATRLLGRSACCEAPSMLFARRGDELEILKVCEPTKYDGKVWYEVKLLRGGSSFHVTRGDITKMKHFEFNYSDFQREWDEQKARELSGW